MTRELLFDAIGGAEERWLLHSERRALPRRILAFAAAVVMLVGLLGGVMHWQEMRRLAALPRLDIASIAGGMGFEGYHAYDIAELENGNPWTAENAPDSLPVYRNAAANPYELHTGLTEEEMHARLADTAAILGEPLTDVKIQRAGNTYRTDVGYLVPPETIMLMTAAAGAYSLEILPDAVLTVRFPDGTALPDDLHFTYTDSTKEQAQSALAWLCERFAALTDFAEPAQALRAQRHYPDGTLSRSYHAYDAAGGIENRILAYNFSYAQFAPDDAGDLMLIRLCNLLDSVTEVGDYPLISPSEASEILLAGDWYTTSPYGQPTAAQIARTDLVYRHGTALEYWMPYYRFYIEIPENEKDGLKLFAAYYVPAVHPDYLLSQP